MDGGLRLLERQAAQDGSDEALLRLRYARIRAGMDEVPCHWEGLVLDPLHLVQMRKSVDKINRMLRKKGCLPLQLVESPAASYIERMRASDGAIVRIKVRAVSLVGDMPGSEGRYVFAARLHHLPDATIIHRSRAAAHVSDETFAEARLAGPRCQHCDKRRGRHDTFIVLDREAGTTLQVGSTCLDLYTQQDCSVVLYAFDKLRQLTLEMESGNLDDAPADEYGCSPLAFIANYLRLETVSPGMIREQRAARAQEDALVRGLAPEWMDDPTISQAQALLDRATAEMLPGLQRHRDGEMLLSERDHNIAVILEAGAVSQREAGTFAGIFAWDGEAEQRHERERMRRLATDPQAQAQEMVALIEGAGLEGDRIVMSPAILAALLVGEPSAALVSLATIIRNPQALLVPPHDGAYLAAPGTHGTWQMRVEATIPYNNGGGHVIKLSHRGADGVERGATFFADSRTRRLSDLGWARGDTVEVQARVDRHDHYNGKAGVILSL